MTAFKNIEPNCIAKDLMDALTIIHDLDLWDEWVYKYADKPLELIDMVNNDRDALVEAWENSRMGVRIKIIDYGSHKIQFIKLMRQYTSMSLRETKYLSEHLPVILPWGYKTKEDALSSTFITHLPSFSRDAVYKIIGSNCSSVEEYDPYHRYALQDFGLAMED